MFKKKRIKNVAAHVMAMLMATLMVFAVPGAGMTVFADGDGSPTGTFSSGAKWTFYESNGNLWTSGSGAMDDYDNSGHTPWYDYKYSDETRITDKISQVNLNGGMTTVGDYAFASVKGITAVASGSPEDGSKLKKIGNKAFWYCENLKAVRIYGNPSLEIIGDEAFWACRSLASFYIPSTVKKIGRESFSACALTEITIPASVTEIGENAFYNCSSLNKIDFQASVEVLNEGLFRNTNLTQIRLPESVKKIESYALGTKAETIDVYLYRGTQIDTKAFENPNKNHTAKANLHYYTNISFISNGAAGNMAAVVVTDSSYKLPECGFTTPSGQIFEGWEIGTTGTTKKPGEMIELTGDLTLKAKWHTHSHKKDYAEKAATCETNGNISYWECACGKLFTEAGVEVSAKDIVIEAKGHDWNEWKQVVAPTETKEGREERVCKNDPNHKESRAVAATGKHTLIKTSAKNPTATKVGNTEYWYCKGCDTYFSDSKGTKPIAPNSWIIPATGSATDKNHIHSLVKTEEKAATQTVPGNIAYWTCEKCGKFYTDSKGTKEVDAKDLIIPAKGSEANGSGNAGAPAAKGKTVENSLASFVVTSSDTKNPTVQYKATKNKKAASISVPNTVKVNGVTYKITEVGAKAFYKNKNAKSAKIGKYVTKIGKQAFAGCIKLEKVSGGAAVKTIGVSAFDGCIKLKKAPIGAKVTSIGDKAFFNCKAMTNMVIPVNVNKLGKQIAGNTPKLKTLTVKTKKLTKKNVKAKAFTGMGSKKTVAKVPKGMAKTYKTLFQGKGMNKNIKVQQSK